MSSTCAPAGCSRRQSSTGRAFLSTTATQRADEQVDRPGRCGARDVGDQRLVNVPGRRSFSLAAAAAAAATLSVAAGSSAGGSSVWPQRAVLAYKCADALCLTE